MANYCEFDMRVVGKRPNINELISLLKYEGTGEIDGFGRIYELNVTNEYDEDKLSSADLSGDCAWSIYSGLIEDGLLNETKRLHLVLEAYSREPGMGFAEHYIISGGEIIGNEVVAYNEYHVDILTEEELENLSFEAREDIDTIRKVASENDGYFGVGGFGDNYANFMDLTKILSKEDEAENPSSKVETFYELRKHFITEDITSRYPESDAIQSLNSEKLDLLAGKVLASLGKNDAYFEIYWNTIENVVKEEGLIGAD